LLNRIVIPKAKKIRNTFRRFSRSSRNEPIYASNKLINKKRKEREEEKKLNPKDHRSCTGIYNGRAVYILEDATERKRKHDWMIETKDSTEKVSRNLIEGCDIDNSNAEMSVFNINNNSKKGEAESLRLHNNMYAKLNLPTGTSNIRKSNQSYGSNGSNGSNQDYANISKTNTQARRNALSETSA
jgi:hypothetical protein